MSQVIKRMNINKEIEKMYPETCNEFKKLQTAEIKIKKDETKATVIAFINNFKFIIFPPIID